MSVAAASCAPEVSPLRVRAHPGLCDAALQLTAEKALFDALEAGDSQLHLWQPRPALIVTAAEAALGRFAPAAEHARRRGFAVHVRATGGGAVALGPGMLVVSHLYAGRPGRYDTGMDGSYAQFAGTLLAALAFTGAVLSVARVPGAYCDGRFDLSGHGRKVGGLAQRRRTDGSAIRIWVHAALSIEAQAGRYPDEVSRFYADLESPRLAATERTTTLADCLHAGDRPGRERPELLQRSIVAIERAFRRAAIGRAAIGRVASGRVASGRPTLEAAR
jgi:lipoate-protein ligase A